MHRILSGASAISLFLFLLSLPLLHLHPGEQDPHHPHLHSHVSNTAGHHDFSGESDLNYDDGEPGELETIPVSFSAIGSTCPSTNPGIKVFALLMPYLPIESGREIKYSRNPEPRSKAPPGLLTYRTLRSPPA